jgi:hypothetical protein
MKSTTFNWAKVQKVMSKTLCSLMIATAIVSFSSCGGDDEDNANNNPTNSVSDMDFYVVGAIYDDATQTEKAVMWKNGVETVFATAPYGIGEELDARDIFVSNGNVYVLTTGKNVHNTLWTNGVPTTITNDDVFLNTIFVSGNDVYAAGGDYNNAIKIYKNGVLISTINGNFAYAYDIAVSGNDVYVVGTVAPHGNMEARLWKNGVETVLSNGTGSTARKVVVVGNDVYVGGSNYDNETWNEVIWKNGVETKLSAMAGDENVQFRDIAVEGNDVYVLGTAVKFNYDKEFYGNAISGRLWKNGVVSKFATGCIPTAISVVGNNVYTAGYKRTFNNNGDAIYQFKQWKNGVETGSFGSIIETDDIEIDLNSDFLVPKQ